MQLRCLDGPLVLFVLLPLVHWKVECREMCYYISYINISRTDSRPRFMVDMSCSNDTGVSSITRIDEDIPMPITRMLLTRYPNKGKPHTIYNATSRLCDLNKLFQMVPLLKIAKNSLLKSSNHSLSCPLPKGVYVMDNMRINPKNPGLSMLYQPKSILTLRGGMSEELPSGKIKQLSNYIITGQVFKKTCHNE